MSYQSGEIYFVREQDRSGGQTKYVKIGLVRAADERDSFSRLLEHQTGNPRKLTIARDQIVKTDAVDMVEAQLHRLYATQRISGEWFEFAEESTVEAAVAKAKELAHETAELVKLLDEAEALTNQPSVDDPKSPTADDWALADQLATAKAQSKICYELDQEIKGLIRVAAEAGADVSGVGSIVTRKLKPKFMKDDFKEAHPDLWEKYLVEVRKWQQSFLLKAKNPSDETLGAEFAAAIASIRQTIASVTSHELVTTLNESQLTIRQLKGVADWNATIAEARLKISIGLHAELTGICTWKRFEKVSQEFEEVRFAQENPELAQQFMSDETVITITKGANTKA